MKQTIKCLITCALVAFLSQPLLADEILDWNKHLFDASVVGATSPLAMTRIAAIVHAAVFDAVNGIERRYAPIHVAPDAHPGASRRAAAVQAAYEILVRVYPAQKADLDAKLEASLNGIASEEAVEHSQSIKRGIAWGQTVANAIWTWRSGDGINSVLPPYTGVNAIGFWRPTPPGNLPGAGLQFATMTTWVTQSFWQFRPGPPPLLNSAQYTDDFNEVKSKGRFNSATRSADESSYSVFWNSATANSFWNGVGVDLSNQRHLTFSENAKFFALLNLAMADAAIGCWDAKYIYIYWRPITAIVQAANDGNPATAEDLGWTPLITTPNHPDYTSGHSCVSGAAGKVLSTYFGDNTPITVFSNVLGTTRSFSSFTVALEEVKNARIFGGIHFRTACNVGQQLGINVADYVLRNGLLPVHGKR